MIGLTSLAALSLAFAACGTAGASDPDQALADTDEVATLADTSDAATGDSDADGDAETTSDATPEEAALAFSQCMRDEGVDFPDLAVDAEGNINLREGFANVDRNDDSFRDAREACQDELAAGGFGGGNRREALESPEIQDALVEFSDCVRDQGYDVGDLTLGQGNGPGQNNDGQGQANAEQADAAGEEAESNQPPQGQREGGFGNRTNRFAQQLGLDPEDPEVIAAIEVCTSIIEDAFTNAGVGGPANNGNGNNNGNNNGNDA